MVVIGNSYDFPVDITLRIASLQWIFGGHARQREVTIVTEGRRAYGMQPQLVLLPQSSDQLVQTTC